MKPVVIEGVVEHGRHVGRRLGFPTANIAVPPQDPVADGDAATDGCAASDGVYRSRVQIIGDEALAGRTYDAMSNLGGSPSLGCSERRLETHLFGFEGSLYGLTLRVELLERIRDQIVFEKEDDLRAQIEKDKEYILKLK